MKPTALQLAQHNVVVYYHVPPAGTGLDTLKDDAYWSHVAKQLRPGHRIEVLAEDGAYWAMLLVREVGRVSASVEVLQHVELNGGLDYTDDMDVPFIVKWRGPKRLFGVLRREDSAVVKDEFQTKAAAVQWMQNHLRNKAA